MVVSLSIIVLSGVGVGERVAVGEGTGTVTGTVVGSLFFWLK